MLIAGTSCVDFSNRNTKKQGLDDEGESGQTFYGMLRYIKKHRPRMVLLENVCKAEWQAMTNKFKDIKYAAAYNQKFVRRPPNEC